MTVRERLTFGHGVLPSVRRRPAAAAAAIAREPAPVNLARIETWDWGWGGLLIFSILLFFRPQDQVALVGALHVSDVAAVIGLVAMAAINLSRRQPITRVTPELLGVLALGAIILVTIPFSFWPGGSMVVFTTYYMQVALIFLLMVNTVTSPRRVDRICTVIVLAFGLVAARVIVNYVRGVNLVEGDRAAGPVGGFFSNPNDLALNLVAFMPLALMYVKRPGPALIRLASAAIAALMLIAIVFTKSRSGQLGFVAMLATFLIVSRSLKPATVMALVLGGLVVLPALPSSYWERMASITDEEKDTSGSREERRVLMQQAWNIFLDHPLTGIGVGQFQNYAGPDQATRWRVTHNTILQLASELGIFAVVAFGFLIARAFGAAWWTRRSLAWIYRWRPKRKGRELPEPEDGLDPAERLFLQTHGAAMVACLAGWFVCAMFASVAFNWTFYYLLGLSVTARDVVRTRARAYARAKEIAREDMAAA